MAALWLLVRVSRTLLASEPAAVASTLLANSRRLGPSEIDEAAFTAETKKGKYVYYHCTDFRGGFENTYIREERTRSEARHQVDQRQRAVLSEHDRGYEDFVERWISEDFWNSDEQRTAALLETVTYSKPFDRLVRGNQTGEWRGRRDSNPRPLP